VRLQSEYGSRPVVQPVWSARRPVVQPVWSARCRRGLACWRSDNNFVKGWVVLRKNLDMEAESIEQSSAPRASWSCEGAVHVYYTSARLPMLVSVCGCSGPSTRVHASSSRSCSARATKVQSPGQPGESHQVQPKMYPFPAIPGLPQRPRSLSLSARATQYSAGTRVCRSSRR
jgi:hypothetical protein